MPSFKRLQWIDGAEGCRHVYSTLNGLVFRWQVAPAHGGLFAAHLFDEIDGQQVSDIANATTFALCAEKVRHAIISLGHDIRAPERPAK